MTDAVILPAEAPASLSAHPLDPAGPEEFLAGRRILAEAGLLTETTRFAYYGLEEPPKDDVLAYSAGPADGTGTGVPDGTGTGAPVSANGGPGTRPDRRLRAFLIDVVTGESSDVVVRKYSVVDGIPSTSM